MRVLTVYAHPDDESFGPAAVLAKLVHAGAHLHGLWLTRGEHGQAVADPPPPDLASLRAEALHAAADLIGYTDVALLAFEDGTLAEHPEIEQIVLSHVERVRPDAIFTFGPAGITRHADHIAVHHAALAAFHARGDHGAIYYDAVGGEFAQHMGIADEPDGQPNTFIDVTEFQHIKEQALAIHARHVADAVERLARLRREPMPIETLYRDFPPVGPGDQVRTIAS
jgi:LmbE family N-acetylglucosaminyl deacetylase